MSLARVTARRMGKAGAYRIVNALDHEDTYDAQHDDRCTLSRRPRGLG